MLNYEEGGERTPLEGDPASESFLHEVVGAPPTVGRRNLNTESMFEFGSRAGFWRVHRIFTEHGLPLTVYAVGAGAGAEPGGGAGDGRRRLGGGEPRLALDRLPGDFSEDEEREHMRPRDRGDRAGLRRAAGRLVHRPRSRRTRAGSSSRRAASSTTRTTTRTSCPTGSRSAATQHLVIPYTLDANDFKFLIANGFVTADDFYAYLVDSFEQLYAEGGRMMSVGLHCRIVGRPGRAPALDRFLAHVKQREDVWVTTRAEIARHWRAHHPPG